MPTRLARLFHALAAFLCGTFLLGWFLLADQVGSGLGLCIFAGLVLSAGLYVWGPGVRDGR